MRLIQLLNFLWDRTLPCVLSEIPISFARFSTLNQDFFLITSTTEILIFNI